MFAKLLFIILTFGATSCGLLVIRQQRIDTFHEITQAHQRLLQHEQALWELRVKVTEHCRPHLVRDAMKQLKLTWRSIPDQAVSEPTVEIRLASQSNSTLTRFHDEFNVPQ